MNEKEDYFRFKKVGHTHILCDRIPLNWKQILILPASTFLLLLFIIGWLAALIVALVAGIGYMFYRFAAWFFYSEIQINEHTGQMEWQKKLLSNIKSSEVVTEQFDIERFEFVELSRSGQTKFLMRYLSHKPYDLLILKDVDDKNKIKKYLQTNFGNNSK